MVTAANMNTYLSDELTYLKAVLDGTDLQNVAVHANKTLSQGGMRVHRHPYANNRHIESGSGTGTGSQTYSVTFTDAYGTAPRVVATLTSDAGTVVCALSILTTGCTIKHYGTNDLSSNWIAEGAD